MSSFRIALVQPGTALPPDAVRNVAAAIRWIGAAAGQGALSDQWPRPDLHDRSYRGPAEPAPRRAAE